MLKLREVKMDWISAFIYRVLPLSQELQRIKELFPTEKIIEAARPFYDDDMGRPSEDPVLLTKLLFLSFFFQVSGDEHILYSLKYRLDWRQFCGLSLYASLPDRTTLVKFRRHVGAAVVAVWFEDFVAMLKRQGLIDEKHRFFDGTPAKARAHINPYRDEVYEEPLESLDARLAETPGDTVELTPELNPSPVELKNTSYSVDQSEVTIRRAQPMKSVAERQAAGDPDAHFQRGKQGKASE